MTDKEVKRLSRRDLLAMMLTLSKENEQLKSQLEEANRKLADRRIAIEESGSLAEAVLRLNGMFETAQSVCEQYIQNIQMRCEEQERNRRKEEIQETE